MNGNELAILHTIYNIYFTPAKINQTQLHHLINSPMKLIKGSPGTKPSIQIVPHEQDQETLL